MVLGKSGVVNVKHANTVPLTNSPFVMLDGKNEEHEFEGYRWMS